MGWKPRIFALSRIKKTVYYFPSEEVFQTHLKERVRNFLGTISLQNASLYIADYMECEICFELCTPARNYFIQPKSKQDLQDWVSEIGKSRAALSLSPLHPPHRPLTACACLSGGGQPAHAAFVVPDDGQVLSYAEMAERIETLAGRLAAAGVRRGDRVALTLPNSPDFVQLMLAVTLLGAAAAPLNPAYTESEYTFYLEDVAPRVLLMPAGMPTP